MLGLPNHWEPPSGFKAASDVEGYTIAEFSRHMHTRIWSKTEQTKMTRWKAHVKWYESAYKKRGGDKTAVFKPIRFLGFAVRMYL